MISSIISRLVILVFGTLYPAYASYKAVRTKNLKEYVKWMMYWIVFALFTCTETFTDVFLSWFPFYYEVKIVIVLWLLSPATKGSSILYRKFVHPALCRREQEIDEYIAKAKDQGYHTVLNLGTKGVNYATTVIMQTAIKGGGGLVQQLRKSYSLSDLTECEPLEERVSDETDDVLAEPRVVRRGAKSGFSPRRSASESNSRSPMYFPEVDVDVRPRPRSDEPDFSHIKSSEDISSGYSSADNSASLARAGSIGAGARARGRSSRTAVTSIKRPQAAEESEVIIEELQDDDNFQCANIPSLVNFPSLMYLSHTHPPFIYQYVGDQIKILQVLGNYPFHMNPINGTDNITTDHWDQKDKILSTPINLNRDTGNVAGVSIYNDDYVVTDKNDIKSNIHVVSEGNQDHFSKNEETITKAVVTDLVLEPNDIESKEIECKIIKERCETLSLDDSRYDNDSAETDDEASYGTPENSPKTKKRLSKGKYGKAKAPLPPVSSTDNMKHDDDKLSLHGENTKQISNINQSQESLNDIVNNLPKTAIKESGLKSLLSVNPIVENKRRHKSKSPARVPKNSVSGIGKLLQLPSKLAFWHKNDDMTTIADERRISSANDDEANEQIQINKEFNVPSVERKETAINLLDREGYKIEKSDDQISFYDAVEADNEDISRDIIDKSVALQKLIEAKIENHPEYKFNSLNDEMLTQSKSTDV